MTRHEEHEADDRDDEERGRERIERDALDHLALALAGGRVLGVTAQCLERMLEQRLDRSQRIQGAAAAARDCDDQGRAEHAGHAA